MKTSTKNTTDLYFLSGGGEMGELTRVTDWDKTPLGNPNSWPQSLRTMVAMMLDNPFGMYIAWGKEYTQLYNDAFRPILGTTKHPQALGISTRVTFTEIWETIGPMFEGVMNGKPVGFPDFMVPLNRNGFVEECYFDFSYSPIKKEDGEIGGVLVTVIETTNKKKSEEKLKESEERFRIMAESTDILIATSDETTNATYFNKAWNELTGRTVAELLNFGWADLVHPEDRERFVNFYIAASEKRENWKNDFRILTKSGNYRWLLATGFARFNADKTFAGYISSCVDITESKKAEKDLKESEQRVRSLVESAPFPIGVYIGNDMHIELANQAMMDVWGKGNDVVGKSYKKVMPELESQKIFAQYENVLKTGIPFRAKNQHLDIRVNNKLQPFYFNYDFTPLYDTTGKVYGVMNTGADVTDLNFAKLKVQESENRLRSMILQSPVAMCILMGQNLVVELANEMMFELWGKTPEEVMNKPLFDAVYEPKNQGFEELIAKVFQTGETVTAYGLPATLNRNGKIELVYVTVLYQPYKDTNGDIIGVLAVASDITAQVVARKKIEEAEEKARLAINSAELGVYEITYGTDEMITDKRFQEIWGVENSVSRKEYLTTIHPDDLKHRQLAHEASLISGQLDYQARVIWKDKSVHWVRVTGKVIYNEKQKPLRLIGIIQDITKPVITQQKIEESEKNIRNIILQAPVAMCIMRGPSFIVEIANNKMFELWGKQKDEVISKPLFDGLPEAKEQGIEQLLLSVYNTGERFIANERPVDLPRNGKMETVYINFVYEPLKKSEDSTWDILAVAIDATPQVIARQKIEDVVAERTKELADANTNLQKSNAELAQFAYIASHDLQEPLRKITTYAEMMENRIGETLDEQSHNYLRKINNSSSRMNTLIRDVLTYSELVKENEVFADVDLNLIIENIKTDYDLLIEQKGGSILFENLPVVEAIPLQMSQLFGNLVSNALKFAKHDVPPIIRIETSVLSKEQIKNDPLLTSDLNYYKIRFSDNGIGFKPEYEERIFNIFQRLHRKSEYEGTGIGLAMCKKIVLNHHGNINARGSSEAGAVFNIVLPKNQ